MQLHDRLAVISGASAGLGAALSKAFAAQGCHVVMLARTEARLIEVAQAIHRDGGKADWVVTDLGDLAQAEAAVKAIYSQYGTPDILINNAGIGRFLAIDETTPQAAIDMMMVPYGAAFALSHGFVPTMIERGSGLIINITSPASRWPWAGSSAYIAARWAMRGFSQALMSDLQGTGVRSILITPGKISSTYFEHNPGSEERIPAIAQLIPTLTPEQVAAAIVKAVQIDSGDLVVPRILNLFFWLDRLFPRLLLNLIRRTGWKRTRT